MDNKSSKSSLTFDKDSDIETNSVFSASSLGSLRNYGSKKTEYVDPKVAVREQKAVFVSKTLVIAVLVIAVALMASLTYVFVTKTEQDAFEAQFNNYAMEIISVSHDNAAIVLEAVETFSTGITSVAKATGQAWPFVRVPDFEAKASRIIHLAGTLILSFCPIIPDGYKGEWEMFYNKNVKFFQQESIDYTGMNMTVDSLNTPTTLTRVANWTTWEVVEETRPGPYLPIWQSAPWDGDEKFRNYNYLGGLRGPPTFHTMNATQRPVLNYMEVYGEHRSQLFQPIFEDIATNTTVSRRIVGVVWTYLVWTQFLENMLPDNADGVVVVIDNNCGNIVSYQINGLEAILLGGEDLHDPNYDYLEVSSDFVRIDYDDNVELPEGMCAPRLTMHIYPSDEMKADYTTNNATYYSLAVVGIFFFTSFVFVVYDYTVNRRQAKVMARVIRQDKIVSNLFPGTIKDRLYGFDEEDGGSGGGRSSSLMDDDFNAAPLADLFPSATIFFADIAGFTAWSSAREPSQVFTLLENIYGGFDKIANQHGVFKVETVGDCYVAVAGLPEARDDHAVVMAKFARDCMHRMPKMVHKLEVTLGPDTGDLQMRIGLHSGQVTAGVLRGERSRFQLFGDSVNTAARMESSSSRGKIQLSSSTAALLRERGRSRWIKPRDEKISVKGKGEIQTYWLKTKEEQEEQREVSTDMSTSSEADGNLVDFDDDQQMANDVTMTKKQRLVEWNVDVLRKLLQQIVAARESKSKDLKHLEKKLADGSTVLEQFKEIITLPKIDIRDLQRRKNPDSIELGEKVVAQLRDYITNVANMYQENAFHNFEHASHVTASVRKMLTRIVSYENPMGGQNVDIGEVDLEDLVGHSYGITSDPLTQFAVVLSAVIHDMDHPGVPNTQLVKEKTSIAQKYKQKSVAEQNSVDLAWDMLLKPQYKDLRACIYCNEDELKRFRQLLVNVVLATDICDKELQALRKARWAKAFSETPVDSTPEDDINRKATIVLEHLIQASDVSHTMQHWQIYKQWNQRFFMEMYGSYKAGRAAADPSEGWYKGEIGFFDFYIIPLAKKLENCGVFGVSSHEYLNYATSNRDEWAQKGEEIVKEYLQAYQELEAQQFKDAGKGRLPTLSET